MGQTHSGAAAVLHEILARPADDPDRSAELLETVSAMARPSELTELLLSLYKDDQAISACTKRSFRHPLGFDKLALIDALPLFILRIHAWWPRSESGVDHVHNHRFSFVSSIVCGSYDMQMYTKDPNGSLMVEYQEEVTADLGWRLQRVATTRIKPLTTIRLQQGASYALPAETLHRITVQHEVPCLTLFLQTKISRSTTQVFVDHDDPVPAGTPKRPFSCENYRQQLASVISLLDPRLDDL
jgi:hypothetical protein